MVFVEHHQPRSVLDSVSSDALLWESFSTITNGPRTLRADTPVKKVRLLMLASRFRRNARDGRITYRPSWRLSSTGRWSRSRNRRNSGTGHPEAPIYNRTIITTDLQPPVALHEVQTFNSQTTQKPKRLWRTCAAPARSDTPSGPCSSSGRQTLPGHSEGKSAQNSDQLRMTSSNESSTRWQTQKQLPSPSLREQTWRLRDRAVFHQDAAAAESLSFLLYFPSDTCETIIKHAEQYHYLWAFYGIVVYRCTFVLNSRVS